MPGEGDSSKKGMYASYATARYADANYPAYGEYESLVRKHLTREVSASLHRRLENKEACDDYCYYLNLSRLHLRKIIKKISFLCVLFFCFLHFTQSSVCQFKV